MSCYPPVGSSRGLRERHHVSTQVLRRPRLEIDIPCRFWLILLAKARCETKLRAAWEGTTEDADAGVGETETLGP